MTTRLQLFVYNLTSRQLITVIEGESTDDVESTAAILYPNDAWTYNPNFGDEE